MELAQPAKRQFVESEAGTKSATMVATESRSAIKASSESISATTKGKVFTTSKSRFCQVPKPAKDQKGFAKKKRKPGERVRRREAVKEIPSPLKTINSRAEDSFI